MPSILVMGASATPTTPQGGGYVAHLPLWGHLLVLSPTVKRMGPPLPTRDMWAICRSSAPVLVLSSVGDPQDGQVYKANLPTCRPLQVLFPSPEAPPPLGTDYVGNMSTCGSALSLSPTVKRGYPQKARFV